MPTKDNQSDLAGALQSKPTPPPSTPQSSSGGSDPMIVRLPSGERIELGEKNPRN